MPGTIVRSLDSLHGPVPKLTNSRCCAALLALCFWLSAICRSAAQQPTITEELTNAAQVLALPAELAHSGIPIRVRGVVTVAEKYWNGQFFVQDESGGVFVVNVSPNQPRVGDLVEVRGTSSPGAFAPVIYKPAWEKVGT